MPSARQRHNVNEAGRGERPMLFAHGFGCDQNMWRYLAPEFERDFRVVLYDLAGSGRYDPGAWRSTSATPGGA